MKKQLKSFLRSKILGYDLNTVYFSQGGEDATLLALFRKKIESGEKGTYVDIGAYHPVSHSNTYLFYRENWTGINIDARPGSMKLFHKIRPKDINLEIGIGSEKSENKFYEVIGSPTMNSFNLENIQKNGIPANQIREVNVKVDTLANILSEHFKGNQNIDFLSVDVEGLDLQVLQSNNWEKYKPSVIIVELECKKLSDLQTHPISQYLASLGYSAVAKNIILSDVGSVFFVHDTFTY